MDDKTLAKYVIRQLDGITPDNLTKAERNILREARRVLELDTLWRGGYDDETPLVGNF